MTAPKRISADERVESDPTYGLVREEAFTTERLWAGLARAEPRSASGWHHHGDHDTAVYVLSGAFRLEFGPGGKETIEGHPGDFVLVPANTVHRESNPADEGAELVVVRGGTGVPTVNVDGPDA